MKTLILILMCLTTSLANAQTLTIRCKFSNAFNTRFDNSSPVSKDFLSDLGELVFDQLDVQKGTGRIIGNAGSAAVSVIKGNQGLHILEGTASGNLNITTIFDTDRNGSTNYYVVHSRHLRLSSGPFPSQHVGNCQKL